MKNLKFLNLIALTFISLLISCDGGTNNETDTEKITEQVTSSVKQQKQGNKKGNEEGNKRTSSANIIKEGTIDLTENNLIFTKAKMHQDQENSYIYKVTDKLNSEGLSFSVNPTNFLELSVNNSNVLTYKLFVKNKNQNDLFSFKKMSTMEDFSIYRIIGSNPIEYTQIGETDDRDDDVDSKYFGLNLTNVVKISINFKQNVGSSDPTNYISMLDFSINNTKRTTNIDNENIIQINSLLFENVTKL